MDSIGMPSWLRIVLVAGLVVLVTGTGLFAYRWYYRPTTLTIAVGSLDGDPAINGDHVEVMWILTAHQ